MWALVLAHPALIVTTPNGLGSVCPGYSVRNLYGTVGLDRYKDFVLDWPDTGVTYPRVFLTPEGVAKYREAVKADPDFPLASKEAPSDINLNNYYWFTGNPETAQKELPGCSSSFSPTSTSSCRPSPSRITRRWGNTARPSAIANRCSAGRACRRANAGRFELNWRCSVTCS